MPAASKAILIIGAIFALLAFFGSLPPSRSQVAAPTQPAGASSSTAAPSKYPRCAGSLEMARCEKMEADLAAEAASATRQRAAQLDADRAKNMQIANSSAPGKPFPSGAASKPPVRVVAPVVARQRDYSCLSTVTLNLNSTNYSGIINVELRSGVRPGSTVLERSEVFTAGTVRVTNVCPGNYFFAFSTYDSPTVSTTRYFDVQQDSNGYSMPEITVTFSKSLAPESQRVGTTARSSL